MDPSTINVGTIIQGGAVGIAVLLIFVFAWYVRHMETQAKEDRKERASKDDKDRAERLVEARLNREVLTNHLSMLIKDYIESQAQLTGALTHLTDGVENFQKNCHEIQGRLTGEIDRMKQK